MNCETGGNTTLSVKNTQGRPVLGPWCIRKNDYCTKNGETLIAE